MKQIKKQFRKNIQNRITIVFLQMKDEGIMIPSDQKDLEVLQEEIQKVQRLKNSFIDQKKEIEQLNLMVTQLKSENRSLREISQQKSSDARFYAESSFDGRSNTKESQRIRQDKMNRNKTVQKMTGDFNNINDQRVPNKKRGDQDRQLNKNQTRVKLRQYLAKDKKNTQECEQSLEDYPQFTQNSTMPNNNRKNYNKYRCQEEEEWDSSALEDNTWSLHRKGKHMNLIGRHLSPQYDYERLIRNVGKIQSMVNLKKKKTSKLRQQDIRARLLEHNLQLHKASKQNVLSTFIEQLKQDIKIKDQKLRRQRKAHQQTKRCLQQLEEQVQLNLNRTTQTYQQSLYSIKLENKQLKQQLDYETQQRLRIEQLLFNTRKQLEQYKARVQENDNLVEKEFRRMDKIYQKVTQGLIRL